LRQKARLAFLLGFVATNEFTHFEREARPFQTRMVRMLKWFMQRLRPLFGVSLPPPPPTLVLPSDPAELCTMFVPHARLQHRESLEAEVADAQRQLRAKLVVIGHLEAAAVKERMQPQAADSCEEVLGVVSRDMPVPALRHRLGLLLLQLEAKEARIQELLRAQHGRRAA
jgi:hypothetical protein